MKRFDLLLLLVLGSCSAPAPEAVDHQGPAAAGHSHDLVTVDRQQIATLGITTTAMERRSMEGHVRLTGRIMASPVSKAQLTSPIGAKVLDVLVEEGSVVKKGQPLIALTDMEFLRMQEDYLVTQALLERAAAERERQRTLVEGNAAARKTLEQAKSEAASLEVRLRSLADQLRLLGVDVAGLAEGTMSDRFLLRSPISGRVNNISVFLDARVEPTRVLLEVMDLDHFHVHLNAYERDLPVLREGVRFGFQVLNMPGHRAVGEIFSVGRSFDTDNRSIPVHAHVLEGSARLVEGMSVVAEVPTSNAERWALPDAAIQRSGDKGSIFMLTDSTDQGMTFERIAVVPLLGADGYTSFETEKAIPPGARFAANNVFYLWSMLENEGHDH